MGGNADLIEGLPKAELHVHIEGTLEPSMMLALARRNGINLPYASEAEIKKAYNFGSLQDFLDLYYQGMSVLQTEQDFYDLTEAYLRKVHGQNVRYTEIFFDPQGHTSRGISFEICLNGIWRAMQDIESETGLTSQLIMCFLRHLDESDAEKTLDLALRHKDRILAIGLDSSEEGHPPEKFARVFERARNEGFLIVAHAGEEGPPEYVWQALDILGVDRIDHGNRSLEDTELVRRLAKDQMALTVCPLSNLRLRGIERMEDHPVREMLDAGLRVSIHSDDPSYFGGYVNENFKALDEAIDLSASEIIQLARNGFDSTFLPNIEKQLTLAEFDRAAGED